MTKLQRSLEDAEDDEELTNELVVVVLQLLGSVPAVAIVGLSHLLAVDFLELKKARLLLTSAQGILTRICALSGCMFSIGFLAIEGIISFCEFSCISLKLEHLFANMRQLYQGIQ